MRAFFLIIHSKLRSACLLGAILATQATAGFSSIYAFGDGVCTTTADLEPANLFYGPAGQKRYCNGRIWIEVMSGWQGVTYDGAKNVSDYGHLSSELVADLNALGNPADAATSLFIIWCCDADFVDMATNSLPPYTSQVPWNDMINQSIIDHTNAVNSLYAKGVRTIVMPNAVNIASIPLFNSFDPDDRNFIRDRVIQFNAQFETAMSNLMAINSGLKIIRPNVFAFFEQVLLSPTVYGLVNPTPTELEPDINAATVVLPGASAIAGSPGSNYVFWDYWHPTARFQMHLAAFIQQIITPVKVSSISLSGANVNLQVANIPLGRAGSILGSANLQPPWAVDQAINESFVEGGSTTKTYTFAASGLKRFYRAAFPVVWVWP